MGRKRRVKIMTEKIRQWKTGDYIYWAAALLPFVISAAFYSRLPERVPTHWSFDNVVNGYSSRNMAAWGIPAFLFLMAVVVNISFAIDPSRKNIEKSRQMKALSRWGIVVIAIFVQSVIMVSAVGVAMNVGLWTKLGVGILIVAIGNYLPKCRQNYSIGIKLPWTLSDEKNWRLTHRMAGRVWMAGGAVMMACAFFDSIVSAVLFFSVVLIITVVPALYSYGLYRKKCSQKQD